MRLHDLPSPNHDARPDGAPVDMLILHYTGMASGAAAIARLRDPAAKVSAHYVVEEDGRILRLVPEGRRAWHAGVSHWRGATGLNARSIGIEVVNPGHEHGYRPFPALQMAALCDLCLDILARHPIPPRHVLAHSDIAPDRKEDPGELFDWEGLARNGVGLWPAGESGLWPAGESGLWPAGESGLWPAGESGLWPETAGCAPGDPAALLAAIGYRADLPLPVLLRAFQRHWRPDCVDGIADNATLARLAAVAAACG